MMKKIILTAVIALGFVAAASAQPRAIGARLGWAMEASYQHTVNNADFVEVNLGTFGYHNLSLSSTYNFMIAQPNWTDRGEWGFYAGPGLAMSFFNGTTIAVQAQVGLEYTFWFPLQLAVDLKPQFGAWIGNHSSGFYTGGLYGFAPAIAVRYRF